MRDGTVEGREGELEREEPPLAQFRDRRFERVWRKLLRASILPCELLGKRIFRDFFLCLVSGRPLCCLFTRDFILNCFSVPFWMFLLCMTHAEIGHREAQFY